jgi:hypothetical protein
MRHIGYDSLSFPSCPSSIPEPQLIQCLGSAQSPSDRDEDPFHVPAQEKREEALLFPFGREMFERSLHTKAFVNNFVFVVILLVCEVAP